MFKSGKNHRFKQSAINLPGPVSFYPTKLTAESKLRSLIETLRPVETELPLIRLGSDIDGGYLLPNDLDGISACFSPGVDISSAFELDCANRGMEVFMADASVDGPAASHKNFHFAKKFIGGFTTGNFVTLDDWVSESNVPLHSDLLLQMDIEGFEYEAIMSSSQGLLKQFRIIVVEFHKLDGLLSEALYPFISRCLEKIRETHACVHIHPNNVAPTVKYGGIEIPRACEFTFLRRDRISTSKPAMRFPHPLDRDCCENEHQVLPKCWYA